MISEKISMDCWKSQDHVTRMQSKLKGYYLSANLQEDYFASQFLEWVLHLIGDIKNVSGWTKAAEHPQPITEIRRETDFHFEIDRQISSHR